MKGSNVDLFNPPMTMDSDFSTAGLACGSESGCDLDFSFAFNNNNFSDRVLKIETIPDLSERKSNDKGCTSIAILARNKKRQREEIKKETVDFPNYGERILNCNVPDTKDGVSYGNEDVEDMATIEEVPSGDEAALGNDSLWKMDCETVLRVIILHISSPILAAKSPFFYKLLSNGMRESEQQHVTLRIHSSEEAAVMDLLNFMYSNTLPTRTPPALLDVLMAADKFEVASCIRYCSRSLQNLPMTCVSALHYLDLPSTVSMADAVQPLADAAKQFLAARFKDMTKFQDELLNLPLAGIEAVLSSDDLQVCSEDSIYDFVLKWARIHYPKLEDRREILDSRLSHLIRFPYMTCQKLKKVLACNDFFPEVASKVVLGALLFKAEAPYRQRSLAAKEDSATCHQFVERSYKSRPVKVLQFELPYRHCIVYLDLKRKECARLFPAGQLCSHVFYLSGQGFFLSAHCNMDQNAFRCFGLFLEMQDKGSVSCAAVACEFSVRSKPTEKFVTKYKGNFTLTGERSVWCRNLFGMTWTEFLSEENPYFINGVVHLRAVLTIKQ
ncbi:BTB/POZ domain-containing protein POB1-like isoform X2 [Corylus avellana]|uniref:BTB/POZ domain-containing protein POB1-like isoform X2 n=1 Tax=Corylus avellana TaxID=13451 RepID=UPI00286CA175|nr:BTB/POZ domain-containing protein POB1-like isoform X2 [Corylus avellana]